MNNVGMFNGHLVNFAPILVFLRPSGIFSVLWYLFSVLVCCTKKNLATVLPHRI
jgi:hypothetical protein